MPIDQPFPRRANAPGHDSPWLPPAGAGTELVPAGVWWDAVRVRLGIGERLLARLGPAAGAVLKDPCDHRLYLLTDPGATADWAFTSYAAEVQLLSTATWVAVPPRDRIRARGPYWLVPPDGIECCLTESGRLHAAVVGALAEVLGPRTGEPPVA